MTLAPKGAEQLPCGNIRQVGEKANITYRSGAPISALSHPQIFTVSFGILTGYDKYGKFEPLLILEVPLL